MSLISFSTLLFWFTFVIHEVFCKFVHRSGVSVHFDQLVMVIVGNDHIFRVATHVNHLQSVDD